MIKQVTSAKGPLLLKEKSSPAVQLEIGKIFTTNFEMKEARYQKMEVLLARVHGFNEHDSADLFEKNEVAAVPRVEYYLKVCIIDVCITYTSNIESLWREAFISVGMVF